MREQEAARQVDKIERTTHTIAREVVVPSKERRQPEHKDCLYNLVGSAKWNSQTEEEPDHESSGDERIEMRSDLHFVG